MAAIFISYRRDDHPVYAGRLHDRLVQLFGDGAAFFDQHNIETGATFPPLIDRVIDESRLIVCIVGPAWLDTVNGRSADVAVDYVRREVESALARRLRGESIVLPVLIRGASMPAPLALAPSLRPTLAPFCDLSAFAFGDHEESDWTRLLDDIGRKLPGLPRVVLPERGQPLVRNPDLHRINRQRSLHFRDVGRVSSRIGTLLNEGSRSGRAARVALVGPPGCGKTQLALHYMHESSTIYQGIWWSNAEAEEALDSSLARLRDTLGLLVAGSGSSESVLVQWLDRQEKPWLLVFDGCSDALADSLESRLPDSPLHHVLITSSAWRWPYAKRVAIEAWSADDGALFLRDRVPATSIDEARSLSASLSGSPLALDQAAGYIAEHGIAIADYAALLDGLQSARRLFDGGDGGSRTDSAYPRSIADTVRIAYGALSPAARSLLRLLAASAPEWLPERYIRECEQGLPAPLAQLVCDDAAWIALRSELHRAGLITAARDFLCIEDDDTPGDDAESVVMIRRLVQKVLHLFLIEDPDSDRTAMARILSDACRRTFDSPMQPARARSLAIHAARVGGDPAGGDALLSRAAGYLFMATGDPYAAYPCALSWKDFCEARSDESAVEALTEAEVDFASVILAMRNFADAERWARHALSRMVGAEVESRVPALSVVIKACLQSGRHQEALDIATELLKGGDLARRRPGIALDLMMDTAEALRGLGRLDVARSVQQKVIATLEAQGIGGELATDAQASFAATCFASGRFEEALPLQRRIVEARRTMKMQDPFKRGCAAFDLARTLARVGDREAAIASIDEAIALFERALLPDDRIRQSAWHFRRSIPTGSSGTPECSG